MNLKLALALLASLSVSLFALEAEAQTKPTDFSDAKNPIVTWPFEVTSYWTEDDGNAIYQHSRVVESSSYLYDYFKDMKHDGGYVGGKFMIMGLGKQAEPGVYTVTLIDPDSSGRNKLTIKPDGAGSVLIIKGTPNATVTGYFKRALYEYRLGDGLTVQVSRWNNKDE